MIILIDADKAFDKIQYPFLIKTLSTKGIQGTLPNLLWIFTKKHKANTMLTHEILNTFPLGWWKIKEYFSFTSPIHSLLASAISQREKDKQTDRQTDIDKWHPVGKEKNKIIFIHRQHDCLCIQFYGIYKNTTRTNKWVYQVCRIKFYYTKFNYFSILVKIRNFSYKILFTIASKIYKILKDKSNKISLRSVHLKLYSYCWN